MWACETWCLSGELLWEKPLLWFGLVGDGAGGMCWEEGGYAPVGEVLFMGAAILGSRDNLTGPESSIDSIDMLLPGRVEVDGAGSSRKLGNGSGGGGIWEMGARPLLDGEGGNMGRLLNGGGGGGGGISCVARDR